MTAPEGKETTTDVNSGVDSSVSKIPDAPNAAARSFSATRWAVITCLLATLAAYFLRRGPELQAAAVTPTRALDSLIGFTPATAHKTLLALGPEGREIYKEINIVDFVLMPVILTAWLLDTFPPRTSQRATLRWMLAFVYMFGDISENVCVAIMLRIYPRFIDAIAWACCVGNLLKWSGSAAAMVSIVYEGAIWFRGRGIKEKPKAG